MAIDKIIEILKEHIHQLQDDDGNLRTSAHVHFDLLFPEQTFKDWNLDFCLKVFNYVVDNYEKLKPNNRMYLRLGLPLQGVSNTLVTQPPDIKDLTANFDDMCPPLIEIIPFEEETIVPWNFEIYKRQLPNFDFKSDKKMFAHFGCTCFRECWEEYSSCIYVEYDPEPIQPWSAGPLTIVDD